MRECASAVKLREQPPITTMRVAGATGPLPRTRRLADPVPERPSLLDMRTARLTTALLLVLLTAGCGGTATSPQAPAAATDESAAAASVKAELTRHAEPAKHKPRAKAAPTGTAGAALAKLPVKGRAPKTGYERSQFGDGWLSVGGCDTRDRILKRDLTGMRYLDDCRVQSGTLADPYTATRIVFERGGASEVDIDHVVALSDAWQKGAQQWTPRQRVAFANDPLNLLSVQASANRRKSDGDAATWLPSNKSFRCAYVARQIAVKTKYRAWVSSGERDAIRRVLQTCPAQKLLKAGARVNVPVTHTTPDPEPTPDQEAGSGKHEIGTVYANCDAVRAAAKAPLLRGSADYAANPQMDRDHDGVACE